MLQFDCKHPTPARNPETRWRAPGATMMDGAAPPSARQKVGSSPLAHPPLKGLITNQAPVFVSEMPTLLRDQSPASPIQLSLLTGALSAPASHAILSPAEMSAILLSLLTRQDMETIAARLESTLCQDITKVTQTVQDLETLFVLTDSVIRRLNALENLTKQQQATLTQLHIQHNDRESPKAKQYRTVMYPKGHWTGGLTRHYHQYL